MSTLEIPLKEIDASNTPIRTKQQKIQDVQYVFPYHHLVSCDSERFTQSKSLSWGYVYWSYVEYVCDRIAHYGPTNIVEIGCGDGRVIGEIARRNIGNIRTGIDYSPRAIALANALNEGVQFHQLDIAGEDQLLKDSTWGNYDMAILIEVLEHIPIDDAPHFVAKVREALRPGGRLIITVPSVNKQLNKKHYRHFDERSIRAALENSFEVIEVQFLNGESWFLTVIVELFCNNVYTISSSRVWNRFYRLYKQLYLESTPGKGNRLYVECIRR